MSQHARDVPFATCRSRRAVRDVPLAWRDLNPGSRSRERATAAWRAPGRVGDETDGEKEQPAYSR
jgi:hypothetical protein